MFNRRIIIWITKPDSMLPMDLGTKEDPEGPVRSFTIASSPTEVEFILISTRIRDTPFKKKLANLEIGTPVKITAPVGSFVPT